MRFFFATECNDTISGDDSLFKYSIGSYISIAMNKKKLITLTGESQKIVDVGKELH